MAVDHELDLEQVGAYEILSKGVIKEEFKEFGEICGLIESLSSIYQDNIAVETAIIKFIVIVDQYQEQPHLLDPHLEELLNKLLTIVRDPASPGAVQHLAFQMLYLITKTRGYKIIVRLLPHEVADVEPVLQMLSAQNPTDFQTWESRYMLLLWLAMVCMIPFDLKRLDSNLQLETGETRPPVMDRIIQQAKCYLCVSDKCRDAAAYMLSRFLTRPDMKKEKLPEVLDWALCSAAGADVTSTTGVTATFGILRMLALLFKQGKREDLVDYAGPVLQRCQELKLESSSNTLMRKLNMKLAQRLGLTFLKARVAAWRYQRGSRSLSENLKVAQASQCTGSTSLELQEEDEEYDIPDQLEDIIELLLHGLRDKDTVVRWSAAKGVGRVTGRLPQELADEVVESIMGLFTVTETDTAWHGGCLALAELGRRGLLLPHRLPSVVPVIIKALSYDEKRGNFSVGSHVRDAACYVCWSFARAYDPEELKPHVPSIASALVMTSIFDREINVRRAAAAAFQENVGRQGTFPHGIDILTTCDYFAVGNRTHCYQELSVFVGQFEQYTIPLVDHLMLVKLSHWDSEMRELAASGLHNLTCKAPDYTAGTVLPKLVEKCSSLDLCTRHGAVLGAAEVSYALASFAKEKNKCVSDMLNESTATGLKNIIAKLAAAQMFRGLGGELMRQAACVLIEKLSLANIPLQGSEAEQWQELIDDCLQHTEPTVQAAAVECIPAFMTEYYCQKNGKADSHVQDLVIRHYLQELESGVETTRQGYAQAVGALPHFMLQGQVEHILQGLVTASTVTSPKNAKFAMARSEAIKALGRVCVRVGVKAGGTPSSVLCEQNTPLVYQTLFSAMKDYTLDSRGDVGAWVREASMSSLRDVSVLLVKNHPPLLIPHVKELFCHLAQQASEKIDRTRAVAGEIFAQLLYHKPEIPDIPHIEELRKIFPREVITKINWAVAANTFPRFTLLLDLSTYCRPVLLGLTISVCGLTESLVKHSAASLLGYLREHKDDKPVMITFTKTLLEIFEEYQRVNRVSLCMFKMLDQLLANDCFSCLAQDQSLDLPEQLLKLSRQEIIRCADVQKLLASIDVFCGLLQFPGPVLKQTIFQLMVLLGHKFPIVRKTTANKLYESMVTYEGLVEDEMLDQAMNTLSDTQWDHDLAEVRPIRNQLCDMFGVSHPVMKQKTESEKK